MAKDLHLGVSAFYHDSAIAIVNDAGKLLFCSQEERFSRTKHDKRLPTLALARAKQEIPGLAARIATVSFYENPYKKRNRQIFQLLRYPSARLLDTISKVKSVQQPRKLMQKMKAEICQILDVKHLSIDIFDHHLSHAASSYFTSGKKRSLAFVFDGVGEWASSSVFIGEGHSLEKIWTRNFPHSIGLLYSAFTQLCGFMVNSGEYKLMGLAPFGKPIYSDLIKTHVVSISSKRPFYTLNLEYFDFLKGGRMVSEKLLNLFELKEIFEEDDYPQKRLDIAASIQIVTEEILVNIVSHFASKSKIETICMAGGVALNCVANAKIRELAGIEDIYIQPASGDAGGALGAALLSASQSKTFSPVAMPVPYLGAQYSDEISKRSLKAAGIARYQEQEHISITAKKVAELLIEGKIGGIHYGRSEFGPRALGNRSIIASALGQETQRKINMKIKFRESFRPFAPIVLMEDADSIFEKIVASKYMLLVFKVADFTEPEISSSGERLLNHFEK